MHNLAIALHKKNYQVTGSDDEIFEPSRSRLARYGLLPEAEGWFPGKIVPELDAVILGMHARKDNPELEKAVSLGLKIYSYPEFMYEQTKTKTRAVIGGSHGKTTITSMIMHVLKHEGKQFDYLVGSQLEGFETMAGLDDSSGCAVIEGDEYFASPLTPVPKFHLYHPHIGLISGIAWDHINVFPTFENYAEQFTIFIQRIEAGGSLVYCEKDETLKALVQQSERTDIEFLPYSVPKHSIRNGITYLSAHGQEYPLRVFGEHNLMNLEGARLVCEKLGIPGEAFYKAITSFSGAARRLELVAGNDHTAVYKDFAHSPSKLSATIHAVKQQYPDRKLIAVMELHTFSSLNKNFLAEYKDCMDEADEAIVFYSPRTVAHKKLEAISKDDIRNGFNRDDLTVTDDPAELKSLLTSFDLRDTNLLLMSSGNWGGIPVNDLFTL